MCSLTKFIISSAVTALASHCHGVKEEKAVVRAKETDPKTKVKTGSQNAAACHEVCGKIDIHIFCIICITFLPENKATVHVHYIHMCTYECIAKYLISAC